MLTERAKKQEVLLKDFKSREEEFLKMQEDYEMLKSNLSKMEEDFQKEKRRKEALQDDIEKKNIDYDDLMSEHEKLSTALSVCAQTIKTSLKVKKFVL